MNQSDHFIECSQKRENLNSLERIQSGWQHSDHVNTAIEMHQIRLAGAGQNKDCLCVWVVSREDLAHYNWHTFIMWQTPTTGNNIEPENKLV